MTFLPPRTIEGVNLFLLFYYYSVDIILLQMITDVLLDQVNNKLSNCNKYLHVYQFIS